MLLTMIIAPPSVKKVAPARPHVIAREVKHQLSRDLCPDSVLSTPRRCNRARLPTADAHHRTWFATTHRTSFGITTGNAFPPKAGSETPEA